MTLNIGRSTKSKSQNALGYDAAQRNEVRRTLRDLEKEGEIARIRKNRYVQPDTADLVTGTLSVHEAGYAFLTNEKRARPIFSSRLRTPARPCMAIMWSRGLFGAPNFPGTHTSSRRSGHPDSDARERNDRRHFATNPQFLLRRADDPRLVHNIYVQPSRVNHHEPRRDDKVVVRLEAWESRHVNPEGKIIECLGPRTAPGVDILSIIRKYHLPLEFPKAILEEASAISETVTLIDGREDLRQQFIVTIDPDDARDFDDAIQVEEIKGGWQLGVHIADVSAYVRPGSALDQGSAAPWQQCLFARPCDSDVARAVEQRCLQLESACRSPDPFRFPPIRPQRPGASDPFCADRHPQRASADLRNRHSQF